MKIKLLFLLLFGFGTASAQIANIPNTAFRDYLLNPENYIALDSMGNEIVIDANDDGQIQVSEAMVVWGLGLAENNNLENLDGIQVFGSLRNLGCAGGQLISLNVQGLQYLEHLSCYSNNLTTLNASNAVSLKEIHAYDNNLTSIDISNLPNLEKLLLFGNHLTSLDYAGAPNLKSIDIGGGNNFTSFTLTGLDHLEFFTFDDMYEPVSLLTIANLPSLTYLQMGFAQFQNLELINLPALTELQANNNPFVSLDLSGCPALENVWLTDTALEYINLKNGSIIENLNLTNSPQIELICVDEGEQEDVENSVLLSGSLDCQIVTTCPEVSTNVISGNIRHAGENDLCDASDSGLAWRKINVNTGSADKIIYSNTTGGFNYNAFTGTFILTPEPPNTWFSIAPASASVTFSDNNENLFSQDFCMSAIGDHYDAEVTIVPIIAARPGFDATYKLIYRNNSNQSVSGTVALSYDDNHTDFISALPAPVNTVSGILTWAFNLEPAESAIVFLTFNVNSPTEIPGVNIDDVLNYTATIITDQPDELAYNSTMGIKQVVVGSFDPNDIACLQGAMVDPDKIGEFLHYNINFENTGTAAAEFIVVENNINAAQFDISTLEILDASHPMVATIEGNKITFRFDDINLDPEGKGNITYKIRTLEALQENDVVMQEANIFFDYNFPLMTNQAETIFAVLGTHLFKAGAIAIYPNPTDGLVNISSVDTLQSFRLYDLQGRLLQDSLLHNTTHALDVSGHPSGLYLLEIRSASGVKIEKIVKK